MKGYFQFGLIGKCTFLLLASAWCLMAYWLLWPYNPLEIKNIEITNYDRVAYAGEYLEYEIDYYKKKRYPVLKVTRQLVDGSIILLPPPPGHVIPVGRHKVLSRAKIPDYCYAAMFVFHITVSYQVNPIRTITVDFTTTPFEVRRRR